MPTHSLLEQLASVFGGLMPIGRPAGSDRPRGRRASVTSSRQARAVARRRARNKAARRSRRINRVRSK